MQVSQHLQVLCDVATSTLHARTVLYLMPHTASALRHLTSLQFQFAAPLEQCHVRATLDDDTVVSLSRINDTVVEIVVPREHIKVTHHPGGHNADDTKKKQKKQAKQQQRQQQHYIDIDIVGDGSHSIHEVNDINNIGHLDMTPISSSHHLPEVERSLNMLCITIEWSYTSQHLHALGIHMSAPHTIDTFYFHTLHANTVAWFPWLSQTPARITLDFGVSGLGQNRLKSALMLPKVDDKKCHVDEDGVRWWSYCSDVTTSAVVPAQVHIVFGTFDHYQIESSLVVSESTMNNHLINHSPKQSITLGWPSHSIGLNTEEVDLILSSAVQVLQYIQQAHPAILHASTSSTTAQCLSQLPIHILAIEHLGSVSDPHSPHHPFCLATAFGIVLCASELRLREERSQMTQVFSLVRHVALGIVATLVSRLLPLWKHPTDSWFRVGLIEYLVASYEAQDAVFGFNYVQLRTMQWTTWLDQWMQRCQQGASNDISALNIVRQVIQATPLNGISQASLLLQISPLHRCPLIVGHTLALVGTRVCPDSFAHEFDASSWDNASNHWYSRDQSKPDQATCLLFRDPGKDPHVMWRLKAAVAMQQLARVIGFAAFHAALDGWISTICTNDAQSNHNLIPFPTLSHSLQHTLSMAHVSKPSVWEIKTFFDTWIFGNDWPGLELQYDHDPKSHDTILSLRRMSSEMTVPRFGLDFMDEGENGSPPAIAKMSTTVPSSSLSLLSSSSSSVQSKSSMSFNDAERRRPMRMRIHETAMITKQLMVIEGDWSPSSIRFHCFGTVRRSKHRKPIDLRTQSHMTLTQILTRHLDSSVLWIRPDSRSQWPLYPLTRMSTVMHLLQLVGEVDVVGQYQSVVGLTRVLQHNFVPVDHLATTGYNQSSIHGTGDRKGEKKDNRHEIGMDIPAGTVLKILLETFTNPVVFYPIRIEAARLIVHGWKARNLQDETHQTEAVEHVVRCVFRHLDDLLLGGDGDDSGRSKHMSKDAPIKQSSQSSPPTPKSEAETNADVVDARDGVIADLFLQELILVLSEARIRIPSRDLTEDVSVDMSVAVTTSVNPTPPDATSLAPVVINPSDQPKEDWDAFELPTPFRVSGILIQAVTRCVSHPRLINTHPHLFISLLQACGNLTFERETDWKPAVDLFHTLLDDAVTTLSDSEDPLIRATTPLGYARWLAERVLTSVATVLAVWGRYLWRKKHSSMTNMSLLSSTTDSDEINKSVLLPQVTLWNLFHSEAWTRFSPSLRSSLFRALLLTLSKEHHTVVGVANWMKSSISTSSSVPSTQAIFALLQAESCPSVVASVLQYWWWGVDPTVRVLCLPGPRPTPEMIIYFDQHPHPAVQAVWIHFKEILVLTR